MSQLVVRASRVTIVLLFPLTSWPVVLLAELRDTVAVFLPIIGTPLGTG